MCVCASHFHKSVSRDKTTLAVTGIGCYADTQNKKDFALLWFMYKHIIKHL